jgi:hypothetical protein
LEFVKRVVNGVGFTTGYGNCCFDRLTRYRLIVVIAGPTMKLGLDSTGEIPKRPSIAGLGCCQRDGKLVSCHARAIGRVDKAEKQLSKQAVVDQSIASPVHRRDVSKRVRLQLRRNVLESDSDGSWGWGVERACRRPGLDAGLEESLHDRVRVPKPFFEFAYVRFSLAWKRARRT